MNKSTCPGSGAYAKDLAGNPKASCPVCGACMSLTKRGTIWSHKSSLYQRFDGKTVRSMEPVNTYGGTAFTIRITFTDDTSALIEASSVSFDQYSSSSCLTLTDESV
jgi:hypothetical protein